MDGSYGLNDTHNPDSWSWVPSANDPAADFPIQNLPLGVFRSAGSEETPRVGVAIGDQVLDVSGCHERGLFHGSAATMAEACSTGPLNEAMALDASYWTAFRRRVSELLRARHPDAARHRDVVQPCLVSASEVELLLPVAIGDFTDFQGFRHHALNVRRLVAPDASTPANYDYLPVACHGRASSIVVGGTSVRRPHGQRPGGRGAAPTFGPSRRLDYELEVGLYVGCGNSLGEPIAIGRARRHMFGICLLNDWSARDLQRWESEPLGPFLAKSFATTVSPWIVTMEALEPFRTRPVPRETGALQYLTSAAEQADGAFDLTLEVWLRSARMREAGVPAHRVSRGSLRDMEWTLGQLVAHHTSNGCNLRPGDLLGSGTVSGSAADSRGCLLELTWGGSEPITLPTGEKRAFLEDGDEVCLRGYCQREGAVRIGLGEAAGIVVAAASAAGNIVPG